MGRKRKQAGPFERIPPWQLWLGVVAVIVLSHGTYIANGFTWLDHGDIVQGRALVPLARLDQMFTHRLGDTAFYRPLVALLHNTDYGLYGLWAPGFHLTNLILHGAVALSAPLFVSAFFPLSRFERLFVALSVGVHPLSWLPVGAISYRQEPLLALFVYLSVFLHAKARRCGQLRVAVLLFLSVLSALLSKETAVLLVPSFVLVWEVQQRLKPGRESSSRLAAPASVAAVELLAAAIYGALRLGAVPELWRSHAPALSIGEHIGTRLYAWGWRLIELMSPFTPSLSDATPIHPLSHPLPLLMVGLVLVTAVVLWRRASSNVTTLTILLGLALAPALNVIPLPRFSSPHYAYAASGIMAGLCVLLLRQFQHHSLLVRRTVYGTVAIWIAIMIGSTFSAGYRFNNDVTLFGPEVERDARFLEGQFYLAYHYQTHGDPERASRSYEAALQPHAGTIAFVDRTALLTNLAGVRFTQGRFPESDALLAQAYDAAGPGRQPTILYNRALIAYTRKDYTKVIGLLGQYPGLQQNPKLYSLYVLSLQSVRGEEGDPQKVGAPRS